MSNQVHRFHDTVAAYLGNGETTYMTPYQARELGKALIEIADDCDKVRFVDSHVGTFHGGTLNTQSIKWTGKS